MNFDFNKLILIFLLFSKVTFSQQIDFKELIKADTNIINKNTVFDWYWSPVMNKQMNFWHIREFSVHYRGKNRDTVKVNTLAFDKEGRLIRWNTVVFKYAFNGSFLGYVDTVNSEAVLPRNINNKAFTDFHFFSELRDLKNNLLVKSSVIESNTTDTLNIKYTYNPDLYIKAQEKSIDGVVYILPEGPKTYLKKITFYRRNKVVYERYLLYEKYTSN